MKNLIPAVLVVVLLVCALPALDQYNVTWDEALGDLFFGQRYLSFFTSFDRRSTSTSPDDPLSGRPSRPDLRFLSAFKQPPLGALPGGEHVLAAATSAVLSRVAGTGSDAFDGYHAVNLLLAAILVWVAFPSLPRASALACSPRSAAVGLLFSSPRVFCHLMANIKDFPLDGLLQP